VREEEAIERLRLCHTLLSVQQCQLTLARSSGSSRVWRNSNENPMLSEQRWRISCVTVLATNPSSKCSLLNSLASRWGSHSFSQRIRHGKDALGFISKISLSPSKFGDKVSAAN